MKKILTLLLILLSSSYVFSQVSVDRFDDDGSRIIISKRKPIMGNFKIILTFNLVDIIEVNGENKFYLKLSIVRNKKEKEYSKGRKLLIKLKDNSIIELINQDKVGIDDYDGFSVAVTYNIQENEIEKIIKSNVVKFRIEDDFNYTDVDIKHKFFVKGLRKAYESILEQKKIDKKPGDEGLYEGF